MSEAEVRPDTTSTLEEAPDSPAAPKVSVIVPVYNAEKTIERCVTSILDQEFTDLELILMDDGSTDGTATILDAIASQDPRVHVVHKENTGVSDTRNAGLDLARGEWIQFLDADDWISPEATKLLVRSAEENDCDMVISDFYRVIGDRVSRKGDIDAEGVLTREEYGDYMLENPADFYYGVLWNKLYRRDIIEEHELRMDVSLSWCEDFLFNLEYVLHTTAIWPLHVPIYYYVKTSGSLASQGTSLAKSVQMKLTLIEYYNNFYKDVYDKDDYRARRHEVYRFFVEFAGDDQILPWQRVSKLGEERTPVYLTGALEDSPFDELYLTNKLLNRCLDPVAASLDLQTNDVRLLAIVCQTQEFSSRSELEDYLDLTALGLSRSLQRLQSRHLVTVEYGPQKDGERPMRVAPTEQAWAAAEQIAQALEDYDDIRFKKLSDEQEETYRDILRVIDTNIRETLG